MTDFQVDIEKMTVLAQIMGEIPLNAGQNLISITFYRGFQAGYFTFQFGWKTDNGELEFGTLDQAIQIAKKLVKRAPK